MPHADTPDPARVIVTNRRARHDYEILEALEAGIALRGAEVKSLREGRVHLTDSYAAVKDSELILYNVHVSPYEKSRDQLDPVRPRKLLLHKSQINRLRAKTEEAGLTLIPLRVYFTRGLAKVEIGLARGKKQYDKRQAIARREAAREVDRAVRAHTRGGGER
jgi:SsrA-binding protein